MDEIDTYNQFMIGKASTGKVVVTLPIHGHIGTEEALNAAAYLAIMADPEGSRFEAVRKAIEAV